MRERCMYDYAIVRVMPRVEREEFFNAGVIVSCPERKFLAARIELDPSRLQVFHASDAEEAVRAHLDAIPAICAGGADAGPIGKLSQRERFHWLVAPRSTIIQTSPVHTGWCREPTHALEHLMDKMVRMPAE